jgi:hypothetical protein
VTEFQFRLAKEYFINLCPHRVPKEFAKRERIYSERKEWSSWTIRVYYSPSDNFINSIINKSHFGLRHGSSGRALDKYKDLNSIPGTKKKKKVTGRFKQK